MLTSLSPLLGRYSSWRRRKEHSALGREESMLSTLSLCSPLTIMWDLVMPSTRGLLPAWEPAPFCPTTLLGVGIWGYLGQEITDCTCKASMEKKRASWAVRQRKIYYRKKERKWLALEKNQCPPFATNPSYTLLMGIVSRREGALVCL